GGCKEIARCRSCVFERSWPQAVAASRSVKLAGSPNKKSRLCDEHQQAVPQVSSPAVLNAFAAAAAPPKICTSCSQRRPVAEVGAAAARLGARGLLFGSGQGAS